MIRDSLDGGGNTSAGATPIIVRRNAAVGDVVAATVVADRLDSMGYSVTFQAHPDMHCVLRRQPHVAKIETPHDFCHINLDGAYEQNAARRRLHFSKMFFEAANSQLMIRGISIGDPTNCRPRLRIPKHEREAGRQKLSPYPRPWVFVCPRSNSYACRQVPDGIWEVAARHIIGTKFWMGTHPAPKGFVDLQLRHLDNVIVWLSAADVLVTVDTGPMHLAAAMGVPVLALNQSSSPELHLSDQADFYMIDAPNLDCLNCQQNLCPKNQWQPPCQNFDPHEIAHWANRRTHTADETTVSAVIATYRADSGRLNHCIESILSQVDEVIVSRDETGIFPPGSIQDPKVRYIIKREPRIGYGRNANYGARHTDGHWILFLNDDVYLNQGAVKKMLEVTKNHPHTGIVAPLLRYPSGQIYHAGKVRSAGEKGWGHVAHRQYDHPFKDVTWFENVCGAAILVNRKGFYEAGGWDENIFLYTEDDDLCLSMRKSGYDIFFTPHADGIHDEGMSTRQVPDILRILNESNQYFGRKWAKWWDHNLHRVPGTFDYI